MTLNDGAIIIAILSGVSGIIMAWAALVRARRHGNKRCEEALSLARYEAEEAKLNLHNERMRGYCGAIDILMLFSVCLFSISSISGGVAIGSYLEEKGATGAQGEQGVQGKDGEQGPQGIQGPPGNSITGPSGPAGPAGLPGPSGVPGSSGPSGISGNTGSPGVAGPQGVPGPTGPPCPAGFVPTQVGVHQRVPVDQDLTVVVCALP